MSKAKILEFDFSTLPLPIVIKGRDGKKKFYLLKSSGKKTLGACLAAIEAPFLKLLQDAG